MQLRILYFRQPPGRHPAEVLYDAVGIAGESAGRRDMSTHAASVLSKTCDVIAAVNDEARRDALRGQPLGEHHAGEPGADDQIIPGPCGSGGRREVVLSPSTLRNQLATII